jgi:hypothetical protein
VIAAATDPPTPCNRFETALVLRCPDLVMGRPSHVYAERKGGRVLLHGTSRVENIGGGPMELRGRRTGLREMAATQVLYRRRGGRMLWPTRAELYFKAIPGQGRYWKLRDAAALEVWTVSVDGLPVRPVRRSPKVAYCLRDLVRLSRPPPGSPRGRVYPSCNQDGSRRSVTIGTSSGWVDRYPSTYHEQYVDVTGLRGLFAYVMTADPRHLLAEGNEDNNTSYALVTLPPRGLSR